MKKRLLSKKVIASGLVLSMAAGMLCGCGSGSSDGEGVDASGDKIKVTIGISADNMPYSYMDENEELAGFEYEVITACGEKLSDKYEFNVIMDEWTNLLVGIDTGNYNFAAGSFGYTDERAEKYIYLGEPLIEDTGFHILYTAGRTDITDFESLAGKTVASTPGLMAEKLVLEWNEENPDKEILLEYPDGYEAIYAGMENGLYDAYIGSMIELTQFAQRFENLEIGTEELSAPDKDMGIYLIFSKDDAELQQDVLECIKEMREDGTLGEMCTEWMGDDFTKID